MTVNFRIRPEARSELEQAALWYEDQRSGLGRLFNDELFDLLRQIVAAPRQFPVVMQETRRALLRRFPYSVYFTTDSDGVVIVAVLHQRRNPAVWRRRT